MREQKYKNIKRSEIFWYNCHSCGVECLFETFYFKPIFCPNCGIKIEWTGFEVASKITFEWIKKNRGS